MAKKTVKTSCIFGGCHITARDGARVCTGHLHPLKLQEEIERLRSTREGGWETLLNRFPDLRTLGEHLAVLEFRADPLKAASTEVIRRSRGHGLDDGITTLGDHIVRPGYSASVKKDEGRLGAAVAAVADASRKLDKLVDPEAAPSAPDPRPRCGRAACSGKNVRQSIGARVCNFCGWSMPGNGERRPLAGFREGLQESTTSPEPVFEEQTPSDPTESIVEAQLKADRRGLVEAL